MVSSFRMKIDLLAQIALVIATALLAGLDYWVAATYPLVVLLIWQTSSALQLLLAYQHRRRRYYLLLMLLVAGLIPLWRTLPDIWGYLPFALIAIWCLLETAFDYAIVYRRPRSFWDL